MGIISQKLTLIGRKGRRQVEALFDTGSSHSMVRESIAVAIAEPDDLPEPKTYESAVGKFTARTGIFADVVIRRHRLLTGLTVVTNLSEELILGVDFLQRWQVRLDPHHHKLILDPKAFRLRAVGARHRA